MARLLIVDDEKSVRDALRQLFEYEGHEVAMAVDGPEALTRFEAFDSQRRCVRGRTTTSTGSLTHTGEDPWHGFISCTAFMVRKIQRISGRPGQMPGHTLADEQFAWWHKADRFGRLVGSRPSAACSEHGSAEGGPWLLPLLGQKVKWTGGCFLGLCHT